MHSSHSIVVRRAEIADKVALSSLGARTFWEAFIPKIDASDLSDYIATAFSEARIEEELTASGCIFLVAERNGQPVGYARLLAEDAPAEVVSLPALHLVRIYVEQGLIGTGVGALLMAACVDEARRAGSRTLWLRVWEENASAIRFYERWGFRKCSTIEFEMLGSMKTDWVMAFDVA